MIFLKVVINEVFYENGAIEFVKPTLGIISEDVGTLTVPLVRRNGFQGKVSEVMQSITSIPIKRGFKYSGKIRK